ncbi:hypothetical protein JS84_04110 [Vibrio vulnificus]|nr:hypothetical protein JS83_10210 [Vibrio vulnificus]KFK65737.1 hypothetical protein JS84_04110 [Vibrio vulnificus]KFK69850.1 hypothetical protein JS85_07210 [Vibrio vulnificus]
MGIFSTNHTSTYQTLLINISIRPHAIPINNSISLFLAKNHIFKIFGRHDKQIIQRADYSSRDHAQINIKTNNYVTIFYLELLTMN